MAWNQPGGSPNNPWGRRSSKDGRGDDAFKNFQRKLENILKGAGADDAGEPPGENRSQLLMVVGIIIDRLFSG